MTTTAASAAGLWIRANARPGPAAAGQMSLRATFDIAAAEKPAEGERPKPRRFTMTAYNGGAMNVGYYYPVVVDLAGIQGTDKTRPIFKNHDPDQLVGHTDKVEVKGTSLLASGLISGAGDHARQVLDAHDNGFPWQASIGARVLNMEFVKEGSSATVNGRLFNGPINVARKTVLGEISFVPLGADDTTSAQIAAQAAGAVMTFEQWLKARGLSLDGLNDVQAAAYRSVFDAEQAAGLRVTAGGTDPAGGSGTQGGAGAGDGAAGNGTTIAAGAPGGSAELLAQMRREAAAESQRVADVRRICAGSPGLTVTVDGKAVAIEAHAIAAGWDANRVELEVLRASRPKAPNAIIRDDVVAGDTLEAALVLAGGMTAVPTIVANRVVERPVDQVYAAKTLEAADRRFRRGLGLQELLLEAAWANGYTGRNFRSDPRGVLRASMIQADGFSTLSLPGILSNVANKFLLQGFVAVENVWRLVASRRAVNDFKTVTSYRLTGSMQFDKVGPTGELKHGQVGETAFTNKADTYGKLFAINRQDLYNDDLGALTAVPTKIGRGSALKFNDVFWTTYLNNGAFFTGGNNNYITGSTTVLSSTSLQLAEQKFSDQVDEDGKPVAITPAVLLVPTALKRPAMELMASSSFVANGGDGTKTPSANTWQGAYQPAVSAYLGNAAYTGNSQTAWYLLANPMDVATVEAAFLNGQEQPIVESADADFDTLGIQMRGYFDFGVALQDFRGGVKSKGAA